MDITKLRIRDILNPKKWKAFIAGTIYEEKIGYYRCEQLIYELYAPDDCPFIFKGDNREDWEITKQAHNIQFLLVNKEPEDYDEVLKRIPEHFSEIGLSYAEQAVIRGIKCAPCVKAKNCTHCGCTMPAALMAPTNRCSDNKWTEMFDEKTWIPYRKLINVKIEVACNSMS